jgi:hypothetical protein
MRKQAGSKQDAARRFLNGYLDAPCQALLRLVSDVSSDQFDFTQVIEHPTELHRSFDLKTAKALPNQLLHACGHKLANDGHDTCAIQHYLGHRNIQNTVRYTQLSAQRFQRASKKPGYSMCRPFANCKGVESHYIILRRRITVPSSPTPSPNIA